MLILPYKYAWQFLVASKKYYNIICIVNTKDHSPVQLDYAKEFMVLRFDDIDCPLEGYVMPNKNDIKSALEFAKDKEDQLVVTCCTGISRSTALGYLIECQRCGSPFESTKELDRIQKYGYTKTVFPNKLIVKLGAEILNNPAIFTFCKQWKKKNG